MKNIIIGLLSLLPFSIYTITITGSAGNSIPLSNFEGKKILFVNTAINSSDTPQFRRLEQLHQSFSDSLVIIVCPSDDFGHNPQSDSSTRSFITAHYDAHYLIAEKMHVKDSLISPLYSWLGEMNKNGKKNSTVKKDFFKYLVDKNGALIGIFDNSTDPNGTLIRRLVSGN